MKVGETKYYLAYFPVIDIVPVCLKGISGGHLAYFRLAVMIDTLESYEVVGSCSIDLATLSNVRPTMGFNTLMTSEEFVPYNRSVTMSHQLEKLHRTKQEQFVDIKSAFDSAES